MLRRSRNLLIVVLGALLVLWFISQTVRAAKVDSVTIDEFIHLPLGYYMLTTGDYSYDQINPPLARMAFAIPLYVSGSKFTLTPSKGDWIPGYQFQQQSRETYHRHFFNARIVAIGLTVLLLLSVFGWTVFHYGKEEGLAALFLLITCIPILANGHLVTLDIPGALGFVLTLAAAEYLRRTRRWRGAVLLGLLLSLSLLLKLSCVVLFPIVCVWCFPFKQHRRQALLQIGSAIVVSFIVLNLFYQLQGTFSPISAARFLPDGKLERVQSALPSLHLFFPTPLLEGIDRVLEQGRVQQKITYLLGELSTDGFWYYHLVAFAVKTPLPFLLLGITSICLMLVSKKRLKEGLIFLVPVSLIFFCNIFFNSQQIGVRHVIAAYPFLAILCSRDLAALFIKREEKVPNKITITIGLLLIGWLFMGVICAGDKQLQNINELGGGDENGHLILADSNIDWGQDLIRLKEYMEEKKIPSINLAYFGRVNPAVYGIRFKPLEKISEGVSAISESFYVGIPYFWFYNGTFQLLPIDNYAWVRKFQPIDKVGSMFIFDLKERSSP
jgi:hypothetical protein